MTVEVAVTFIRQGEKLLLVYNPKWGAFTFPMTKRRLPDDGVASAEAEEWPDAAARPVVECLGRPASPRPILEDFFPEQHLSRRQGQLKFYKYRVFEEPFREDDRLVCTDPAVWLTPAEISSGRHRPISPTALDLIAYQGILEQLGVAE